jgi:F0F1-type ATP synthase assembly protein I
MTPDPAEDPNQKLRERMAAEWARLAEMAAFLSVGGASMAGGTVVGYFVGRMLDAKAGLSGVLAALFAFIGFGLGVLQMVRMVRLLEKRSRKDR